jgi:ribosomal protein L19E
MEKQMRLAVVEAERAALQKLRTSGEITDRAYRQVQWEIDLLESMLRQG